MTTYHWNPLSPVREGIDGLNMVVHPYPYRVEVERAMTAIVDWQNEEIATLHREISACYEDRMADLETRLAALEGERYERQTTPAPVQTTKPAVNNWYSTCCKALVTGMGVDDTLNTEPVCSACHEFLGKDMMTIDLMNEPNSLTSPVTSK